MDPSPGHVVVVCQLSSERGRRFNKRVGRIESLVQEAPSGDDSTSTCTSLPARVTEPRWRVRLFPPRATAAAAREPTATGAGETTTHLSLRRRNIVLASRPEEREKLEAIEKWERQIELRVARPWLEAMLGGDGALQGFLGLMLDIASFWPRRETLGHTSGFAAGALLPEWRCLHYEGGGAGAGGAGAGGAGAGGGGGGDSGGDGGGDRGGDGGSGGSGGKGGGQTETAGEGKATSSLAERGSDSGGGGGSGEWGWCTPLAMRPLHFHSRTWNHLTNGGADACRIDCAVVQLPDGRLFIAGGCTDHPARCGADQELGGPQAERGGGRFLDSAFIYDGLTDTFELVLPMQYRRHGCGGACIGDTVYVKRVHSYYIQCSEIGSYVH